MGLQILFLGRAWHAAWLQRYLVVRRQTDRDSPLAVLHHYWSGCLTLTLSVWSTRLNSMPLSCAKCPAKTQPHGLISGWQRGDRNGSGHEGPPWRLKHNHPECPLSCMVLSCLHYVKVLQVPGSLVYPQSRGEVGFPGNSGPTPRQCLETLVATLWTSWACCAGPRSKSEVLTASLPCQHQFICRAFQLWSGDTHTRLIT